jgi:hypothetical protein
MEEILGEKFPSVAYEDALRDGVILCKLINKLKPGSVPKINTSGAQFKMMENVNLFQKALKDYGVPDLDVFQTVDLFEKKDIGQVTCTIFALGRAVSITRKFCLVIKIINFQLSKYSATNTQNSPAPS